MYLVCVPCAIRTNNREGQAHHPYDKPRCMSKQSKTGALDWGTDYCMHHKPQHRSLSPTIPLSTSHLEKPVQSPVHLMALGRPAGMSLPLLHCAPSVYINNTCSRTCPVVIACEQSVYMPFHASIKQSTLQLRHMMMPWCWYKKWLPFVTMVFHQKPACEAVMFPDRIVHDNLWCLLPVGIPFVHQPVTWSTVEDARWLAGCCTHHNNVVLMYGSNMYCACNDNQFLLSQLSGTHNCWLPVQHIAFS